MSKRKNEVKELTAEHTEQRRAEDLEDGGEDAGGSQRDHFRAHRGREVVCHVVRAYPDCEHERDYEREHQHPYVRKRHLYQLQETDKLVRQVGHDECESLWSLNAIQVFSICGQIWFKAYFWTKRFYELPKK